MFDLETQIAKWKHNLDCDGALSSDQASELESHLRDVFDSLCKSGLSDKEKFVVATNRVGHPVQLREEFAKESPVNVWRPRIFWMLAGYLAVSTFRDLLTGSGYAATAAAANLRQSVAHLSAIPIAVSVVGIGLLAVFAIRKAGGFRASRPRKRSVLVFCLALVGVSVANQLLVILGISQMTKLVVLEDFQVFAVTISIGQHVMKLSLLIAAATMLYLLSDSRRVETS